MRYPLRMLLIFLPAVVGGVLGSRLLAPYHRFLFDPYAYSIGAVFGMAYGLAMGLALWLILPTLDRISKAAPMFRFTIRDLLWLMVVVGMGLAWRAEHRRYVVLEYHYEHLLSDVVWCPDDQKIVWDGKNGFHYEPRTIPPAPLNRP